MTKHLTPKELCKLSARRVNIIAHNEELSDTELADALSNLNGILSMFSMESLMNANGMTFPLGADDVGTGMDDQVNYALVDILAVRLAGVYQLPVPQQIAIDARRAEVNLKRWNAKPIYHKPDPVLQGLSR